MDLLNSFLDKLKLESTKKLELSKKYQVLYFKNGQLCKVTPEETEYTYNARFINSDGKLYDLHDINDIDKLPIPSFLSFNGYGITGSLDYFLKMKAGLLRTNGLINESDHLYRRLYLFMAASNNWFLEEDYLCYCKVLLQELRLEEAESEELKIKSYLKQHGIVKDLSLEIANLTIKNCKKCLKTVLIVIGVIIILGIIGSVIGGKDDGPKKVNSDTSTDATQDASKNESEPEQTVFNVGDTVSLNDVEITLVNITESAGGEYTTPDEGNEFLILEFEIANNSSKDISISSVMNFEAYCDDYSLTQDLVGLQAPEASGKNQLDGSVAAGKKMNGVIAYQVPTTFSKFEVSVAPDFWSSKDIQFVYSK